MTFSSLTLFFFCSWSIIKVLLFDKSDLHLLMTITVPCVSFLFFFFLGPVTGILCASVSSSFELIVSLLQWQAAEDWQGSCFGHHPCFLSLPVCTAHLTSFCVHVCVTMSMPLLMITVRVRDVRVRVRVRVVQTKRRYLECPLGHS